MFYIIPMCVYYVLQDFEGSGSEAYWTVIFRLGSIFVTSLINRSDGGVFPVGWYLALF